MGKFLKNLTNSDNQLLQRRAESINTRAKMLQESLISSIKLKIEEKKLQLSDLTDMGPESSNSLSPSSQNWQPEKWVNQIQELKLQIYELNIQLKMAMETFLELFDEAKK